VSTTADRYWRIAGHRAGYVRGPVEAVPADWRTGRPPRGPWARHVTAALDGATTVLDVGAGDRAWEALLPAMGVDAAYASADPDTLHEHDHADFLAVTATVDAVLLLDVLEHLDLDTGLAFLDHAARVLSPGGALVCSTPNPAHPTSFQASDVTHVRPWPAHDLRGALLAAGFTDVVVHRLQHAAPGRRWMLAVNRFTARALGVDPADHLLAVARAPR
jgi:SAM-dependent methyltransferase